MQIKHVNGAGDFMLGETVVFRSSDRLAFGTVYDVGKGGDTLAVNYGFDWSPTTLSGKDINGAFDKFWQNRNSAVRGSGKSVLTEAPSLRVVHIGDTVYMRDTREPYVLKEAWKSEVERVVWFIVEDFDGNQFYCPASDFISEKAHKLGVFDTSEEAEDAEEVDEPEVVYRDGYTLREVVAELRRELLDKDAEIERLQAEVRLLQKTNEGGFATQGYLWKAECTQPLAAGLVRRDTVLEVFTSTPSIAEASAVAEEILKAECPKATLVNVSFERELNKLRGGK